MEVGSFGYQGIRLRASYTAGGRGTPATNVDETNPELDPKQFERQADHFTECILENKTPKTPGEEGLRDMQYIQSIYKAAGISFG
jgi:predicted dehydrogenase